MTTPTLQTALFLASRPKTWIAGLSPVLIGAALASSKGPLSWSLFLYSLLFSLFIQIGTNYANDYFDFLNGADTAKRTGPARAVASGWLSPELMRNAFSAFFGAAFLVSLPLVYACGPWALAFVFSSITFGILYTGGPRPLGYIGLGELLVLIYFGPVAILGTYFVQRQEVSLPLFFLSLSPGLFSCAVLIANNLRDEESDRAARKNTLVVRFGKTFGRCEYVTSLGVAYLIPLLLGFFLPVLTLPLALLLVRKAWSQDLVPLLPQTAFLFTLFTALLCTHCILISSL